MYLIIRGLVLRITAYNDTDSFLTVLTHSHGKLTVKARGLRRKNSPLVAPCQLLAYSEFTLFEYRGIYTINEAYSLELFHDLRRDLQKLALGSYFAQVSEVLSQEDIPNPELLSHVLNSLYAVSKLGINERKVKSVFELRCACLAGYTPDIHGCFKCGELFPDRFDITAGKLECAGCRSEPLSGIRMPLTHGVLQAMRYVCSCEEKRMFSFEVGDDTLKCLSHITESYLITQLERGFSTLDFYKTLLVENIDVT